MLGLRGETVDTFFEFLNEIKTFSGGFFFHAKEDGVVDAMLELALHLWWCAKEHFFKFFVEFEVSGVVAVLLGFIVKRHFFHVNFCFGFWGFLFSVPVPVPFLEVYCFFCVFATKPEKMFLLTIVVVVVVVVVGV